MDPIMGLMITPTARITTIQALTAETITNILIHMDNSNNSRVTTIHLEAVVIILALTTIIHLVVLVAMEVEVIIMVTMVVTTTIHFLHIQTNKNSHTTTHIRDLNQRIPKFRLTSTKILEECLERNLMISQLSERIFSIRHIKKLPLKARSKTSDSR